MSVLMKSISGIRGIVGDGLDPLNLVKFSSAFAEYCNYGGIIVGRDSRITGEMIKNIVTGTLNASGCDVIDIGICPTPTVQMYIEKYNAAGGIAITASHNPNEWNALKLLNNTGTFLSPSQAKEYLNLCEKNEFNFKLWNQIGKTELIADSWKYHVEQLLKLSILDTELIKKRKFNVFLDCVNGAGFDVVPYLLDKLNCSFSKINCDKSGVFPRLPEPLPENLTQTIRLMKNGNYDVGIVVDPDVDRLVLLTDLCEPFGEENTVTLAVKSVLLKQLGPVCVNLSTTRAVEDIAMDFDVTFYRTPVGEINVVEKMKEVKAVIGGEGSGGVIYPDLHYGRDALVGIALILQYLAETGKSLSEIKKELPEYYIKKDKVKLFNLNPDKVLEFIASKYSDGKINTEDGIRIDFPDYWIQCRKSNTEPIIRFIVEANNKKLAEEKIKELKEIVVLS